MLVDIVVTGIVLLLCAACVWKLISNKRKGISSCSGCSGCGSSCSGHGCSTEQVPEQFKAKKQQKTDNSARTRRLDGE